MQLEPWQYADHFLMIRVRQAPDRTYTFLSDHCTQAEVVNHAIQHFTNRPAGFDVMLLDEESYDLLEPVWRKHGKSYILEG